jgi:hypothetical protein
MERMELNEMKRNSLCVGKTKQEESSHYLVKR